jgi:guanine deaminase
LFLYASFQVLKTTKLLVNNLIFIQTPSMERSIKFMREAVRLSRHGMTNNDGGPFGCVIVKGDEIVGRGWNQVLSTNDPTAHAEVVAIREACKNLQTFQLDDCEIFTSCEPCPMCMGAIYWARPKKVYFANTREDAAAIGFDDSFIYDELKCEVNDRKIEMVCLTNEEALDVFKEWVDKPGKTAY